MRFDELDLEDEILDGLYDMNFEEMTPVQEHTIPVILEGRDLIGCAQTGTGKTAAYTLPLLNRLLIEGNEDNVVKSLIIVPTRELAQQIDQQFQGFSYYAPISTTVVYGGGDGKGWDIQKRGMLMGADVVIATPGRMISHLQNSGVDLSHVECLILDEADRMLDMGFSEDIMKIVSHMPKERQTIMFSATLPPKIRELAKTILRNPAEVNIAISKPNEAIDQSAFVCYESQKLGIIRELFARPSESKTIIFSSSKMKVKELAHTLKRMKLDVAAMHSDLEQAQREEVMLAFKNNKISILVATDIVARGIDIEDIGLVINYDVPRDPEDYIHRIGRTARAAATGAAMTFVNEEEQGAFHRIEKFIEREIRKAELPEAVGEGPKYAPDENRGRGGRGRGRSKGGDGRGHGRGRRDRLRDKERGSDRSGGARSGAPAAKEAVAAPAAGSVPSAPSVAAGAEAQAGAEGAAKRRRRHRGGRRHRRGGQQPEGGAPQSGGSQAGGPASSEGGSTPQA
jgi:superfamily II DNA/RNA helicase